MYKEQFASSDDRKVAAIDLGHQSSDTETFLVIVHISYCYF